MDYKITRGLRAIKKISIRGLVAFLMLIGNLAMIGYYGFLKLEHARISRLIEKRNTDVLMLKQEYMQMQKDEGYKKYLSAKFVAQEKNTLKWKDSLEYLINLLDELTALDMEDRSVALENFQITPEKVNLRGTVASISTIYREGGIIDKFTQFDFIDFLDIPFYRKNGETFQFVLDATITANVGYDGALR